MVTQKMKDNRIRIHHLLCTPMSFRGCPEAPESGEGGGGGVVAYGVWRVTVRPDVKPKGGQLEASHTPGRGESEAAQNVCEQL